MKQRFLLFTLIAGISCLVFSCPAMGAGHNEHVPSSTAITGTFSACVGSTTTLSDATTGGTWTSSNTGVATIGTSNGIVLGIAAGTTTISYIMTSSTVTQVVTINALPNTGSISGASGVCLSTSTTLTDATSGGTWSSGTIAVATVGATTGKVTGVAVGTSNITYTVTNTCGTAHATYLMTVFSTPTIASIVGSSPFCQTTSNTFMDATTNGVWSSSNTAVATVGSSTGLVTGTGGGSVSISYVVAYSCGTVTSTYPVTINPLPVELPITGPSALCLGTSGTFSDATVGDVWSSSNTAVATVNAVTGFVTSVSAGATLISYTGTNGCGSTSAIKIVQIDTLPPSIAIYGPLTVCQTGTTALTDSTYSGEGGVWSSVDTLLAKVNSTTGLVSGISGGATTISLILTNACGTDHASRTITINPLPSIGAISGHDLVCVNAYTDLADPVSGGVWTSDNPAVATVNATLGYVTGVSSGNALISYTTTNACGNSYASYSVLVDPLPVPVISVSGNVFTSVNIYPSYEWMWDGTIIIGATFRSYGASDTGHYTLVVTNDNGCTGSSAVYFYASNAVKNVTAAQDIKIYPNPVQSVLFISTATQVDAQLSTIEGRVLLNMKDAKQLDISALPGAVYYLTIYDSGTGELLKTEKIVKTGN